MNFIENIKEFPLILLYPYLKKKHIKSLIFLLILTLLSAFSELIIFNSIYPLVSQIIDIGYSEIGEKSSDLFLGIFKITTTNLLLILIFSIISSSILKIWISWFNVQISAKIGKASVSPTPRGLFIEVRLALSKEVL